jgi:elongation factor P--(R)-beta-lysine ligase
VEPSLPRDRPTLVERWPAPMAVLARRCDDDPLFAARFEIYAFAPSGARPLELCNAFDELTDPVEQRARFLEDNAKRRALGKPELPVDEEFLAALAALPRSAGCALGVDRLLMLLLDAPHIDDVTALPWR